MAKAVPADSRYIALTTYRRDGREVTTPVWSVPLGDKLYVVTSKGTGKAKRDVPLDGYVSPRVT
jgi:uncharacterized protein